METEELIDKYYLDELTLEERSRMEELLDEDPDFKAEFDFQENVRRSIKSREGERLKKKLERFEKQRENSSITNTHWKVWQIAATIVLLLGLGWLGYDSFISTDYERLYSENFREYPNTAYAITRGTDVDNSLERKAFMAYETDNNVLAISLFTELKEQRDAKPEYVDFYIAQAYMKNGDPEQAVPFLKEVINDESEFKPEALWYLSLAYLKLGKKEAAIQALKDVIDNGKYKKIEAQKLVQKLE